MTDQYDEQLSTANEPVTTDRREFLRSLGKWSQAVIGGVIAGGAMLTVPSAEAASWYNRGGGWHNRGGGSWGNRGGSWGNRGGSWG
ncbi:MAG: hypothetical protein LM550_06175, partial [Candidatus Contendobacter sp.]|nr:hypothetical protein [Candidatus Contendobacter sp.]